MSNWKEACLKPMSTISDAIDVLESKALRIVLVVDDVGKLLGVVTDGDIRRGLIRHMNMNTPVSEIMCKTPTVASLKDDRDKILVLMKSGDFLHIPLVDGDGRVAGLETLQHLLDNKRFDNPVLLMAGGLGKRLRPLTNDTPKPLLKIGNKPILETILERILDAGFHDFYISTCYKSDMVRDYFGDGGKWNVNIRYICEKEPMGTAGALGLLPDDMPDLPLLVMNGDLLTKINFEHLLQFHKEEGGLATMCVREYDFQVPYGVITSKGYRITSIEEKPVHKFFVNAGIYVLEPELVRSLNKTSYLDMPDLLEDKINQDQQINMFPVHEYWLDIGRMEEIERAKQSI